MFKAKKKLNQLEKFSDLEFDKFIESKKKEIVNFHLTNNSFYQNLVKSKDWTWEMLPVLRKQDIQVDLEKRLSKNVRNIYIDKTSGSSGNPFYFAKDKFCHALTWANIEKCFSQHNLYGKKQARFYGIPKIKKEYYLARVKDFFLNRYRFDVFDLSEEALDNWIHKFSKSKYIYLNGYTTVLVFFAKHLKSKNLVLKDICPSLKSCVVTSEMCVIEDKKLMEDAFGVNVINEYGASELDLIAFQNRQNEWILNTNTLFVEILDSENKPVKDGEMGRMVITSLFNKANPFIRYDIGDSGSLEYINAKKIILKELIGRNEDIVQLPSGKKAPGLSFYYVTKSIMEDSSFIKEIKVIQKTLNSFEIQYVSALTLQVDQEQKIKQALFDYLEPNLEITFNRLTSLVRSKSGKLKQFTSLLK